MWHAAKSSDVRPRSILSLESHAASESLPDRGRGKEGQRQRNITDYTASCHPPIYHPHSHSHPHPHPTHPEGKEILQNECIRCALPFNASVYASSSSLQKVSPGCTIFTWNNCRQVEPAIVVVVVVVVAAATTAACDFNRMVRWHATKLSISLAHLPVKYSFCFKTEVSSIN